MKSCAMENRAYRNCNACIWKCSSGCRVWDCEFVPVGEAIGIIREYRQDYLNGIHALKSDGTLVVKSKHYPDVRRVLVENGTDGTLYYPEEAENE